MNILFTCAGRRRYLLKYFKEAIGESGKIIATDVQLSAPALTVADIKLQVPTVYSEEYIPTLLDICKKNEIKILISLNDLELPILAEHKKIFQAVGVSLIVSSPEVIDLCFDKYKTALWVQSLGLKVPQTYIDYNEACNAIKHKHMSFPVIIKPRWGSGSIGVEIAEDEDELEMIYKLDKKKLKRSILATVSETDDACLLIQEMIRGNEYGLDIMNDLRGVCRGVSVKQKLAMRSGETDKAMTINNQNIFDIGKKIGQSLEHIGNLDCDILERNGEYYVLELNPRFGGGYPFSHEAGVNFPKAIVEWVNGNDVDEKYFIPQYNKIFSKCDILLNIEV